MNNKKQAIDLTDLAIGIVVLGIVVSIGAVILLNIRDTNLTNLDTYTTVNETVTAPAVSTASGLANQWGITVTDCFNSSTDTQVEAANFSSSVDGNGVISVTPAATVGDWIGGDWVCSYTAYNQTSRSDYELANDAAAGLAEYGNWFDIIVIVGVASLILTLIFMAFGNRSGGSGSAGLY